MEDTGYLKTEGSLAIRSEESGAAQPDKDGAVHAEKHSSMYLEKFGTGQAEAEPAYSEEAEAVHYIRRKPGNYVYPVEAGTVEDGGTSGTGKYAPLYLAYVGGGYTPTPSERSPDSLLTGESNTSLTDTPPTATSPADTPPTATSPADTPPTATSPADTPPGGSEVCAGGGTGGTGQYAGGGNGGTGLYAGGGTSGTGCYAGGGAGGTGQYATVTVGRITGFGSIYVNGNEFNTADASIIANDKAAAEGDLDVGMKVVVGATNSTANTVEYESEIEGRVEFVDSVNNTLTVMGQTVIVDGMTVFRGVNYLRELKQNDHVDVSGYIDAYGDIRAGFIRKNANGPYEYQVKGFVSRHDPVNRTFAINDLTVDYGGVTTPPAIVDGSFVKVKGQMTGIVFRAAGLEVEDEVSPGSPGQIMEVEGVVTSVYSQTDFEVNGQRIMADGATVFRNGSSGSIALNAKVVVKGTVDAGGIIVADEVTFDLWQAWQGEAAEIRGFVESVDVANSRLRLLGKTIYVDSTTSWRNVSSLAALSPGDLVDIVGDVGVGGSVKADWVEWRGGSAPDDYLNGPVDQHSENPTNSFSILGITVDVSGPGVSFRDKSGVNIDAATFFSMVDDSLSPGEMVAVEGRYVNGVLKAQVVEIGNLI